MTQQNALEPDCLTQRGLREPTSHQRVLMRLAWKIEKNLSLPS